MFHEEFFTQRRLNRSDTVANGRTATNFSNHFPPDRGQEQEGSVGLGRLRSVVVMGSGDRVNR